jgi:hypothetical protein
MTAAIAKYAEGLDPEAAALVVDRTERIRARLERSARDIVEIGRDLLEVKATIEHGRFLAWLEAEFGMSQRTAYHFMSVAEKFATVASLDGITPTALYMLAAPSAPAEARQAAVEAARTGGRVGPSEARAFIARVVTDTRISRLLPDMTDEEFAGLKESIRRYGVLVPIEVDENGAVLDGRQRVRAVRELQAEGISVPDYATIFRVGMSEDEKVHHAVAVNVLRAHFNPSQRAVLEVLVSDLDKERRS